MLNRFIDVLNEQQLFAYVKTFDLHNVHETIVNNINLKEDNVKQLLRLQVIDSKLKIKLRNTSNNYEKAEIVLKSKSGWNLKQYQSFLHFLSDTKQRKLVDYIRQELIKHLPKKTDIFLRNSFQLGGKTCYFTISIFNIS